MTSHVRRSSPRRLKRLWFTVPFACLVVASSTVGQVPANGLTVAPPAHLAAGDDVVVAVFREKDLGARVFVDERNQLPPPRIGLVDVGLLTADMLRDTIRARYSGFLRDPSV